MARRKINGRMVDVADSNTAAVLERIATPGGAGPFIPVPADLTTVRAITDPAERALAAEHAQQAAQQLAKDLAAERGRALRELHATLGTWKAVGEVFGISWQAAQQAAAKATTTD
jgi:hypothetical protein